MDRLVKPDVKELEIIFKNGQKCSATFRLTNLMHAMPVAVFLSTPKPDLFSINQPFSIIPPLSTSSYTLTLSDPSDHPPLSTPHDSVTVRSSMLPTGKAPHDDLRRLFSKRGSHVFKDAVMPISFVGPQVIEFLIAQHNRIPEIVNYFDKAVSGCTVSQLSTLLKSAVVSGSENLVTRLIDSGADVNVKDSNGRSMVYMAVKAGSIKNTKVLIASGLKIDDSIDHVLHEAAALNRVDIVEVLISAFRNIIDINSKNFHGRAPIHIAASNGHAQMIEFCVSAYGANTDVFDRKGSTPLHLAAENGHLEAARCLLKYSSYIKYAVTGDGKTAFALAVENGHPDLYDLLQLGDALQRAARVDDVHAMTSCLSEGADVNGRDQNGWTPLHRAAFKGKIESVKILLNHGAEIDVVDDEGYTPLHCAVMARHAQVARLLIARGAKVNGNSVEVMLPLDVDQIDGLKNNSCLIFHEKEKERA